MKKLFILTALLLSAHITVATEVQQKAQGIATQYQTALGLDATETQAATDLLEQYFIDLTNGNLIDPGVQLQVNNIRDALSAGIVPSATTLHFKITGELLTTDPVYNRGLGLSYNPADLCRTQGTLSGVGTDVYYRVHPFWVLQQGDVEIEDVTPSSFDSYFSLYCEFNPLQPLDNAILSDDDGGTDFRAKLTLPGLPVGKYYLVVTTFSNGESGSYEIEFRSDDGVLALDASSVPLRSWPIVVVFLVFGLAFFVMRRSIF